MKPKLLILRGAKNFEMPTFADSDAVRKRFRVKVGRKISGNPDVVFCQTFLQCADQIRGWDGPCVITAGGVLWNHDKEKVRTIGKLLTQNKGRTVAFMSKWLRDGFIKRGMDAKKDAWLTVLPRGHWGMDHVINGVQVSRFRRKKDYSLGKPPTVIMSINLPSEPHRMRKSSGIPVTLDAVRDIALRHNVRFVDAGIRSDDFPHLEEWERKYNFHFVKSHHKLGGPDRWPGMLESADVFLHPSMCDGWGRAVADAMCVGLPVMAMDAAAIPEIADTLLLYKPEPWRSTRNVVSILDTLLSNEDIRRKVGTMQRAEAMMLTEKHRGDLARIIMETLERRS